MLGGVFQRFSSWCFLKPKICWSPPKDNRVAADVEILSVMLFVYSCGSAGRYGVRCFRWCWSISSPLLLWRERERERERAEPISNAGPFISVTLSLIVTSLAQPAARLNHPPGRFLWLCIIITSSLHVSRFFFFLQTFHSIHSNSQNTPTNPRTLRALSGRRENVTQQRKHINHAVLNKTWQKYSERFGSARAPRQHRSGGKTTLSRAAVFCIPPLPRSPSTLSHLQKC